MCYPFGLISVQLGITDYTAFSSINKTSLKLLTQVFSNPIIFILLLDVPVFALCAPANALPFGDVPVQNGFACFNPILLFPVVFFTSSWTMLPLRSNSITDPSSLIRGAPPCALLRYSHTYGTSTCISPSTSEPQVPTFHTKACLKFTPPSCRRPSGQ